jgi:putative alpha-1,2-mannosidase
VNRLLGKHFTNKADGIPGNDDTGTMSAWAVFSMLGFYPDCPGEPYYTLTSPVFNHIEIDTNNGTLTIEAPHSSAGDIYVKEMTLNGKKLNKYRISHDELINGKILTFKLSNTTK